MQPAVGPWRGVRAAFVAVLCVSCSLAAHVVAGGAVPPAGLVVGCSVGIAGVAYLLSRSRWTFGRVLVVLGAGQLILHPVFDHAAGGAAAETSVMVGAHLAVAVGLAALVARGDLVLWRAAAVVRALLRPVVDVAEGLTAVPVPATAGRARIGGLDLPVPTGVDLVPSAERAPPRRSR